MPYSQILEQLVEVLKKEVEETGDTSCIESSIDRLNELLDELS